MRTTVVRVTTFVCGVLLSAYMYLLVSSTTLGVSPLFVLEEGIAHVTRLPFGIVTAATGLLLLGIATILRAPVGPGTFAVPILFGLSVELLGPLAPTLQGSLAHALVVRVAVLVAATSLLMLGAALIVSASYGASALDAVMLGLASVLHRDTAHVRIAMDLLAAGAGATLGGTAGAGTVVGVLIMGHSFRFWANRVGVRAPDDRRTIRMHAARRSTARAFRPSLSMQQTRLASRRPQPTVLREHQLQAPAPSESTVGRSPDAHQEVDPLVPAAARAAGGGLHRRRRRIRPGA